MHFVKTILKNKKTCKVNEVVVKGNKILCQMTKGNHVKMIEYRINIENFKNLQKKEREQ